MKQFKIIKIFLISCSSVVAITTFATTTMSCHNHFFKPTSKRIATDLAYQLDDLKLLSNVVLKVNTVTKANLVTGTISYTDTITQNSSVFKNIPFNVKVEKNSHYQRWSTKDIGGLINSKILGQDLALNDLHTNALSSLNDSYYYPFWNDAALVFPKGSSHIQNWNKNSTTKINNKLITTTIIDQQLTVSYLGLANTTTAIDHTTRMAYQFAFVKSYDLTKATNNNSAKLSHITSSLTEAVKQYLGLRQTTLQNIDIVSNSNFSWKVISKVNKQVIATITFNPNPKIVSQRWIIKNN